MSVLEFRIDVRRPVDREIRVELEFEPGKRSPALPVDLFLPTWTPGSYLIREFSRHLGPVAAREVGTGRRLAVEKTTKNRFRVEAASPGCRVVVSWSVYAHELSVRTSDLTAEHAYWNHANVLLWPVGWDRASARITIAHPPAWQLACALPADAEGTTRGVATLLASDLDHAMDAPCLCGALQRVAFAVDNVPHAVVLEGLAGIEIPSRLESDFAAIVREVGAVFGGGLPYRAYSFLCLFAAEGHGGLEHADSTTLLASRSAFATEKGYRDFVSLAAHELFHAWNVKRMRPVEFWRYDYENENYTGFLWLVEGWTAYYDDLVCLRAGVFSRQQYLDAAAQNLNGMFAAPGRLRASLRESSHDAWIRLYRPDENTRNSSQNYYGNGAVAAMCLDLWIRRATSGARSLDGVIRALYETTFGEGRGYTRDDVNRVLLAVAGPGAVEFLAGLVDASLDPPLAELLGAFGVQLRFRDSGRPWLGVHFDAGATTIASVTRDSPAYVGGLQPGDELIAIQDLRVDSSRWSDLWLAMAKVGKPIAVLYSRRGVIGRCEVVPQAALGTVALEVDAAANAAAAALRSGWLPDGRSQSSDVSS